MKTPRRYRTEYEVSERSYRLAVAAISLGSVLMMALLTVVLCIGGSS